MGEFKEYDWNEIALRVRDKSSPSKMFDRSEVWSAMKMLDHLPFPKGFLFWVGHEMLDELEAAHGTTEDTTHVYLGFFGEGGRASHLKVGVARDVSRRFEAYFTGNPLECLWVWSVPVATRRKAIAVETALLGHFHEDRGHGEWVYVHGLSEQAATEVVRSLDEVASAAYKIKSISFSRTEV